jgi:organic hydroperoxide reductase OsmC/OhrA
MGDQPMRPLPHHYRVRANASNRGAVALSAQGVAPLESDSPAEFDGPGDKWSPELLLTAAVVDCYVLSFRAIASASKLEWTALDCTIVGVLERADGVHRFTRFDITAKLDLPTNGDAARAERLLEKAERICLITNSLRSDNHLERSVHVGD